MDYGWRINLQKVKPRIGSRGAASTQMKAVDHCERLCRFAAMKMSSLGSATIGCFFSNEQGGLKIFASGKHVDSTHSGTQDQGRIDTYRAVIMQHYSFIEGKVEMDVGCSTSILSIFCAQAGAKRVRCLELLIDKGTVAFKLSLDNLNGEKKKQQQLVVEEGINSVDGDEKYKSALISIFYTHSPDTKGLPSMPYGLNN
ncbi:hypothetical protein PTKIN_Ptkin18bG0036500 [Pterospermum kingtungense]